MGAAVLWELRGERLSSRELRRACGDLSPTVLQARVDELGEAGLVDLAPRAGYGLTEVGHEFLDAFDPLYRFSMRWAERKDEG